MTDQDRFSVAMLEIRHGREVLNIAVMHHLCMHLLTHYGNANRVDLAPQIALLDQCVDAHLFQRVVAPKAYAEAQHDLTRAGKQACDAR